MAPIIFKLRQVEWAEVTVISTAQHRQLLDEMLTVFDIQPQIDLDIMTSNQTLGKLTGQLCHKLDQTLAHDAFDVVLAAGDTSSVMVSALIAFYHNIPFGHVEAGLRTHKKYSPFPEEINRVLAAPLSSWHFAPTIAEQENLLREGIQPETIFVTGNAVIDSLYWILDNKPKPEKFADLDNIITVTTHRRENMGENLTQICAALRTLVDKFAHINIVLPVHPNPNVSQNIHQLLEGVPRVHLIAPLAYDEFVSLMANSILIMTDSGGIQEEAPALGKPVVVLRDTTERALVVQEKLALLAGTKAQSIVDSVSQLLTDDALYKTMSRGVSPYGKGDTAQQIVHIIGEQLGL